MPDEPEPTVNERAVVSLSLEVERLRGERVRVFHALERAERALSIATDAVAAERAGLS